MQKMFDFDDVTKENIKKHNANWLQIPGHPYRILIIEGSGKKKFIIQSNKLLTRYWCYWYAKDPYDAKYQLLIKRRGSTGLNNFDDPEAFIE